MTRLSRACVGSYKYLRLVQFLRHSASNQGVTLTSGLGVIQGRWKWHHSIDCMRVIWAFYSNYGPILHHFRDKARYLSKIAIFHTRPAFDAPTVESLSECCHKVW